ncbi:hypothetical protein J3R82DRAFT_8153 [Butyriboletus roseoflavus]|nr:hypothetical protein J3R82DRAFT_8153 [Butyriboletus roseoflavus]
MSTSSESGPKFRVAIWCVAVFVFEPPTQVPFSGAGIAGLVLAITIGRYNPSIPIDIYEAHDSIDTAGVGITVWRQVHEVMIELGLCDEFKQIISHGPDATRGPCVRRSDIREGGYIWYQRIHRYGPFSMHRQHMITILERHLPASCTVHFSKRLVHYIQPEQQDAQSTSPIILNFADGTTATTDALIGADGVRSAVRKTLFEAASEDENSGDETDLKQYIEATFTGMTVYRCLVPAETLKKETPENISLGNMTAIHSFHHSQFCITYPIVNDTLINVVVFVVDSRLAGTRHEGHWVSDGTRDELIENFENFEPDASAVIKHCEKPSKWALHVVKPLPFCVRGRVALIGDACHAMTPHFGAGAGQAIEDAFVLGRLIAHPLTPLSRIPDALRIYEEIRLPFVRSVASLSLSTGWMYAFMAPGYYDGTRKEDDLDERGISAYEKEGMEALKQEIMRRWDFMDELSGPLQAWEGAELKLQALG